MDKKIRVRGTAKRKEHWKTVKVRVGDITSKVDPMAEVTEKIANYTTSGKVDLPGMSVEDLNGILKGLDSVLGKYDMTVDTISFGTKVPYAIGLYDDDSNSIEFTEDKIGSIRVDVKKNTENFKKYNDEDREEITGFLDRGKISDRVRVELEERLNRVNALTRGNVMSDVPEDEIVAAVTIHEAYHKVYWGNHLEVEWNERIGNMVKRAGVSSLNYLPEALSVSEYGASFTQELFAETGTALAYGLPVNEEVKNIFNDLLKKVNK